MDDESDGLIQQGDQYRNVFYCQTIVSLAGQTEIYLLKLTFVLLLSLSNVGNAICFMTLAEIRINGLRAENFQTLLCSEGWQWLQETHLHMSQWHQYLLHSISTDFSRSKFYVSISIESTWTIKEMEREVYFNNSRNVGMYISSFESQWACIVLVQLDTFRSWQIFSKKNPEIGTLFKASSLFSLLASPANHIPKLYLISATLCILFPNHLGPESPISSACSLP